MTKRFAPQPPIERRAAVGYAAVMAVVAVFQATVAAGAPLGEYTQGGGHAGRLPPARRAAAGASVALVAAFALSLLALHGMGPLQRMPPGMLQGLRRLALAYGVVAVPLNLFTPSAKERMVWGPFAILSLGVLLLAQPRNQFADRESTAIRS